MYYFKGQDFWFKPSQIRDDMKRLKDAAVDSIYLGVHEADLEGGNLPSVAEAARAEGLEVFAVPSRVGGLVAGWHRGVGMLSAMNPSLWALNKDGTPVRCYGPQISIHHPDTPALFAEVAQKLINHIGATGVVWDEPKCLYTQDHSPSAQLKFSGCAPTQSEQVIATRDFFSAVNRILIASSPELLTSLFVYGHVEDSILRDLAKISPLDEFGCDGMILQKDDPGTGDCVHKKLMSGHLQRFIDTAANENLRKFVLVETQRLDNAAVEAMLRRLPTFLSSDVDHIVYYDYPHGFENAELFQPRLASAFRDWRLGRVQTSAMASCS